MSFDWSLICPLRPSIRENPFSTSLAFVSSFRCTAASSHEAAWARTAAKVVPMKSSSINRTSAIGIFVDQYVSSVRVSLISACDLCTQYNRLLIFRVSNPKCHTLNPNF